MGECPLPPQQPGQDTVPGSIPDCLPVGFIDGDGIGPEVMRAARRVLDAAIERTYRGERRIEWREILLGEKAVARYGTPYPEESLRCIRELGIILKGPLTTPVGRGRRSLNVSLRQDLDLYACIRPVKYIPGVPSPLKHPESIDVVLFRENTEDVYAGIEFPAASAEAEKLAGFLRTEFGSEVPEHAALGLKPVSERGSKRLIRKAIRYAIEQGRRSVTLVHKWRLESKKYLTRCRFPVTIPTMNTFTSLTLQKWAGGRVVLSYLAAFLGVASLVSVAWAGDTTGNFKETKAPTEVYTNNRGFYTGIFAGGAVSDNDEIVQSGTAFIIPPLDVRATGAAKSNTGFMVGLNVGYQWPGWRLGGDPRWALLPALELEGYYLSADQTGFLNNPTPRIPEHLFDFRAPMDIGVLMPNLVLTLHTPYRVHPYIGGGVGAAIISNVGASSIQLAPPEPGINHFNSNPDASDWGFAATARAGLRFDITRHLYFFVEYKFLTIGTTNYTFGSTVFPTHPRTSPWSVHYGDMFEHMGVGGIGYAF
ncbi:MAG TPA: isocitrate/isopropylmalate family dehydrogenase [Methylococcus sp.]|nr:isocitrate/isopropylmalate family dehydrogenase [Methylococcus sp.]